MTVTQHTTERTTRRGFLAGSGALAVALSLRYAPAAAQGKTTLPYGAWEDLQRR